MNRQKERLRDHLGQILKDKEVIVGKIDKLVVETEKSVSTSLDIVDARKFRKLHSNAKSVVQNTVKIIDRLYAALDEDEDDDDDEGDDDDDDADDTKLSADESVRLTADDVVKLNETTSDLIKLSSDDSTSPPLVAELSSSISPTTPIVQAGDLALRLPKIFSANHDKNLSGTTTNNSSGTKTNSHSGTATSTSQLDVALIGKKDLLTTPTSDRKNIIITPPSPFGSSMHSVAEISRQTVPPIDVQLDSCSTPDPASAFDSIRASKPLSNDSAPDLVTGTFSPVPSGPAFRPIPRGDPPLQNPASPVDSRSSSRTSCLGAKDPLVAAKDPLIAAKDPAVAVKDLSVTSSVTFTDLNQPFLTKYGPKKTLKPPFSLLPQSTPKPQCIIRKPDFSLDAVPSAHSSPVPNTSILAQTPSSRSSFQHCVKSSFRLNVYDTLNRQFLGDAIQTERKYVPLDRCCVSNIETCDAFPALLWLTISGTSDMIDLGQIIDDVTDFYNETPPARQDPVEERMICAVMDEDGSWYRGKVNRVSVETGEAEVALLDIGKFLIRTVKDILPLISRFVDMPCLTLPCRLRGVGPAPDRHGNRTRDWRSFNEKLDKAFKMLKGLTKGNFKLTAAFKFIQTIDEMFVDVRWPKVQGHDEQSVKDLLIEKDVGIALNDEELRQAIITAKSLPCAVHGEEGSEAPKENFFAPFLRKAAPPGKKAVPVPSPPKTPKVNMMRPRKLPRSPPDPVGRRRYVKSLQCAADDMFYRPLSCSPVSSSSSSSSVRYLRFLFTWIESPDQFYISLESAYLDLTKLTSSMKNFYQSVALEELHHEFDPRVGDFVAAFCPQYDNFYRASVVDVREGANRGQGGCSYYVYFVDFGNSEWKKLLELAPLHQEFAYLPPQCIRCRPWPRLLPPKMIWSAEDTEKMRNLILLENVYTGRIEGESTMPISLKPLSEDALNLHVLLENPLLDPGVRTEVSLNAKMISLGIAREGSPRRTKNSPTSSTKNSIEELRDSHPISPVSFSNRTCISSSCLSSPRPSAPLPPASTQSSSQSSQPQSCSSLIDENVSTEDKGNPTSMSHDPTQDADSFHGDSRKNIASAEDTDHTVSQIVVAATAETSRHSGISEDLSSPKPPLDLSKSCHNSASEESNSMPTCSEAPEPTDSTSSQHKLSTSGSQSSPSCSGTTSSSLSSPSTNGTSSGSLALDSQPPNVVVVKAGGGGIRSSSSTTADAAEIRNGFVTPDNSSLVSFQRRAATKDDFLILKEGEWYLCEVSSFVHPDNFFLRFPFGDGLLANFQTHKGDDDAIFAVYPSVSTAAGESGSSDQIRCLQREIDRFCSAKEASGEFMTTRSCSFKDEKDDRIAEIFFEDSLRAGVRLLSRQENGSFFRSVVREVKGDSVLVYLMDHGGVVHVEKKRENFIDLPEQFGSFPRMALRGRLANVRPKGGSWSLEATNWFIDQVSSKHLIANIKSTIYDRLIVDLWDTSDSGGTNASGDNSADPCNTGDVLINESIVAQGYAEPCLKFDSRH